MADARVTELAALTAPAATDVLHIVDDPAGTPADKQVTVQALLATPETPVDHGNLGATETIDVSAGRWHRGTLNADCTITITGFTADQAAELVIELVQDGTGGRVVTWDPDVIFSGSSAAATTATVRTFFQLWSSQGDSAIYGVKLGGIAFGTPAVTLGTAAAAGSAVTAMRTDATLAVFDATAPAAVAAAAAADAGVAAVAARRDHQHGVVKFHGCKAKQAVGQNVNASTLQVLTLGGEDYDTDSYHDLVTNNTRVTIPAGLGGYYVVTGECSYPTNSSGVREVYIKLNGTSYPVAGVYGNAGATSGATVFCAGILLLSAGDYVELVAYHDSTTSPLLVSLGRLSIGLLGGA